MRFAATVLTGFACLLLLPGLASAQAIGGTVTDTTGGVLPGVTVEARSPALIEQVRTAITDGGGQFQIVALEPAPTPSPSRFRASAPSCARGSS